MMTSFIEMDVEQLAKRVILAPTKKTLVKNRQIIDKLPGVRRTFYSFDSIISEDPNDVINYQPEFFYKQTPSGMPPHELELKGGVTVI